MEMTSLRELHQSMIGAGVDIQQFRFKAGAAEFDCLFSAREAIPILSLTSRGANPKFFKFDVRRPGYWIKTFLGDKYRELHEILYVDGRSGRKLEPTAFFAELNESIPRVARPTAAPKPEDIVRLRHDIEERDRPFFDRSEQRGKGPSDKNKLKTLNVFGHEALEFSIQVNKSSIWSTKATGRSWK